MGNDMGEIMYLQTKVINLDSRPDRWSEVTGELARRGIFDYERFPAIQGMSGENGCALSHYACLKEDLTRPLLLLEDDVLFDDGWIEVFDKAVEQLPDDFDLLYLGANVKIPATRYSENLYQITGGVHCTHAILYSEQGRNNMVNYWQPGGEYKQIDHWLYMRGQALMNCFVICPMVAWQRPSYSDVRLQSFDYRGEMEENAKNNMK